MSVFQTKVEPRERGSVESRARRQPHWTSTRNPRIAQDGTCAWRPRNGSLATGFWSEGRWRGREKGEWCDGASIGRCGELWPAVDGESVATRRNELGESPSSRWTAGVRRWPHPRKSLAMGLVAPWPRGRWRLGLRRAQSERAWRTAPAPRKRERGKSHLEANFGVGRAQGKIAMEIGLHRKSISKSRKIHQKIQKLPYVFLR